MHFCALVAREYSRVSSPRKRRLKGTIPALVKSSVGSESGMREALGTRRCPRFSKKTWKASRISLAALGRDGITTPLAAANAQTIGKCCRRRGRNGSRRPTGQSREEPRGAAVHASRKRALEALDLEIVCARGSSWGSGGGLAADRRRLLLLALLCLLVEVVPGTVRRARDAAEA